MGHNRVRRKRNSHENIGVDKRNERNRPDVAERRGLRVIDGAGGDDEAKPRLDDNGLSVSTGGVQRGAGRGVWVHRGSPGALTRTFDAVAVNAILNHPDVFPTISVPGSPLFDVSGLLADPRNVALVVEGGCFVLIWHEPGVYEVHTNFLRPYRGRYALEAAKAGARWMFLRTDCMTILTQTPATNRAARWLTQAMGFAHEFDRLGIWPSESGQVDLSYWALRYDEWVKRADFDGEGVAFLDRIEAEYSRHGVKRGVQREACLIRALGAFAGMMDGEQPEKAIVLFNRWAAFAGFGQMSLIARTPLMISVGGDLLQFTRATFKVIKCL